MAVLVTGATGFIAQWIIEYLLREHYEVIGTVRSQDKADKLFKQFNSPSNLDLEIVKDIADPKAFHHVFERRGREIDSVLHTASPFHFNTDNYERDLLIPAVTGTKGVLDAIKRFGSIEKVVLTSSFASIVDLKKFADPNAVFTEKDWNPETWDGCQTDPLSAYCASKKFAEEAAWEFSRETGVKLTSINPVFVFGPQRFDEDVRPHLNTSNEIINSLLHTKPGDAFNPDYHASFIDVRDVARAHVTAVKKDLAGERLGISNGRFSSQTIVDIVNERFPKIEITQGPEPGKGDTRPGCQFNSSHSKDLLGFHFFTLEQSVYDTAEQILNKEGRF